MQDMMEQMLTAIRRIWLRRWYVLLIAWTVCLLGWGWVYFMPNKYQASARIHIDTQSLLKPLLQGLTVQTDIDQQIRVMINTLLSRPNLEKIARFTNMDIEVNNDLEFEELLNKLSNRFNIKHDSRSRDNLYTLTYTDISPQQAKHVVQTALNIFIEQTVGDNRDDSNAAQRFLDQQIKEYEKRLGDAEEKLKDFKRKHIGLMMNAENGYYHELQNAKQSLEEEKLKLKEIQRRHNTLYQQLQNEKNRISTNQIKFSSSYNTRIERLQERLDELLLIYTDAHPDVIEIRRTIAELEEKKAEEIKELKLKNSGIEIGLDENTVYQELKLDVGKTVALINAQKVRVEAYKSRVNNLEDLIYTMPEVEAKLMALNRDYDATKRKYDELVNRRESARLSQEAEQNSDSVKFKIIDPPHVSHEPVSPNRPLFISIVLFAGIGSGAAYVLFLYQINPVFDNARTLLQETGLPLLGTISIALTPQQLDRKKKAIFIFFFLSFTLIILYFTLIALQLSPDLKEALSSVIEGIWL